MLSLGIGLGITQQRVIRLGPELIVDGDFPTTDNWTAVSAILSVADGILTVADNGSWTCGYQAITTVIGKTYKVSAEIVNNTGETARCVAGETEPDGATTYGDTTVFTATNSSKRSGLYTAIATTTHIALTSDNTDTCFYKTMSVKEVL